MVTKLVISTALAGSLLWADAALAQTTTEEDGPEGGIGDIVVTAQRRDESIQRAAISIQAFSGEELRVRGLANADDITRIATGVQVGGGTTTQVYIRGVGDFGVIATANPAVVTSLNGVAISRPQAISGNFFDLERIEVLKGPQGTLYGRNASGGALNIIAASPRYGELSGYLQATVGNYDAQGVEGALNLPAGADGGVRLSFQAVDRGGYLTDGTEDDKHQSVRLQGRFRGEAYSLQMGATYTNLGGIGSGLAVIPAISGQSAWTGSASKAASDYYIGLAAANFIASNGRSPPPALFDRPDSNTLFQNIDSWSAFGQLDYDFAGAALTLIPAFRRTTAKFSIQPSFNYSPGGGGTNGETSNQYSLEARLGNSGAEFKWVVGAFAFKEDQSTDFQVNAGLIQRLRQMSDLGSRSFAVFGEGTYSFTDTFRLTAGIRYTADQRRIENLRKFAVSPTVTSFNPGPLLQPCVPPAFLPGAQCDILSGAPANAFNSSRTFRKTTWKLGVEYDVGSNSMFFANVATGFKAGGFNGAVDTVDTTKALAFNPEAITAYTAGLRNRFMDNRLQLNLEGFYWDYSDLQLTRVTLDGTGNVSLVTQNAGKARIFGGSVDMLAKPARNTTLRFGLEFVDSKYTEFTLLQAAAFTGPGSTGCAVTPSSQPAGPTGPLVNVDCSGFQLVRSPKWSGNAGINQVFGLSNGGNVTADVDLAFASSRTLSTSFVAASRVKGYGNLSSSLTYNAPDNRWFVSGFVRNITNATVYTGGPGNQSPFIVGYVTSSIGAPRTWGVRAGVTF